MTRTFLSFSSEWQGTVLPLKKPATQAQFKSHLRSFNEVFGPLDLTEVNGQRVQAFLSAQSRTKSPTTVKNIWATLRLILDNARRQGLIVSVPDPVLPKRLRVEQEWLTGEQMRGLVASAEGDYKAFYALMCESGLRVGEAVALQPVHINLTKRVLSVRQSVYAGKPQEPKTQNSIRDLCLSDWVCSLLEPVIQKRDKDGFVFSTSKGSPWWPAEMLKNMSKVLSGMGLEAVGCHATRRGNVSLCSSVLGMPETILSQRVGHACASLTLGVYAQRMVEVDRPWVDKIAAVLQ